MTYSIHNISTQRDADNPNPGSDFIGRSSLAIAGVSSSDKANPSTNNGTSDESSNSQNTSKKQYPSDIDSDHEENPFNTNKTKLTNNNNKEKSPLPDSNFNNQIVQNDNNDDFDDEDDFSDTEIIFCMRLKYFLVSYKILIVLWIISTVVFIVMVTRMIKLKNSKNMGLEKDNEKTIQLSGLDDQSSSNAENQLPYIQQFSTFLPENTITINLEIFSKSILISQLQMYNEKILTLLENSNSRKAFTAASRKQFKRIILTLVMIFFFYIAIIVSCAIFLVQKKVCFVDPPKKRRNKNKNHEPQMIIQGSEEDEDIYETTIGKEDPDNVDKTHKATVKAALNAAICAAPTGLGNFSPSQVQNEDTTDSKRHSLPDLEPTTTQSGQINPSEILPIAKSDYVAHFNHRKDSLLNDQLFEKTPTPVANKSVKARVQFLKADDMENNRSGNNDNKNKKSGGWSFMKLTKSQDDYPKEPQKLYDLSEKPVYKIKENVLNEIRRLDKLIAERNREESFY